MTRDIVAFDFETTGLNPETDFIVQIGLVKFNSTTYEKLEMRKYYILPNNGDFEVSPEAQAIHGITKEFLIENGKNFKEVWPEVSAFIGNCDMLSYNGNHFDVPFLYNTLIKNGLEFDFEHRHFYDALVVERKRHSNKLEDVYKRYTGKTLDDAHDALADVNATVDIFNLQRQDTSYSDIVDEDFYIVSPEDFLKKNENGDLVFTKGKYSGKTTNEICKQDPSYIKWVFEKFSTMTKNSIKTAWQSKDK